MNFDKWFNSQDRLLQVILLIIPFVGWIVAVSYTHLTLPTIGG